MPMVKVSNGGSLSVVRNSFADGPAASQTGTALFTTSFSGKCTLIASATVFPSYTTSVSWTITIKRNGSAIATLTNVSYQFVELTVSSGDSFTYDLTLSRSRPSLAVMLCQ